MPTITFAEHLTKIPPAVRPTVRAARRLVKGVAPKTREIVYQSKPARSRSALWKLARYDLDDGNVAGIGVFPTYVCLYFYRGRDIDDGSGLLEGGGKDMRFIRLSTPSDAQRPAVKRMVRRAFKLGGRAAPGD